VFIRSFFAAALVLLILATAIVRWPAARWQMFDPEYGMWQAKTELLEQTASGTRVILGDSRLLAAYRPSQVTDVPSVNLAVGGGTPVEAYYLLKRLVDKGVSIPAMVISFTPTHLTGYNSFHSRTLPFDVLNPGELDDLVAFANGMPIFGKTPMELLTCRWQLPACFKPYYRYLIRPGRTQKNHAFEQKTLDQKGWHLFGLDSPANMPEEVGLTQFKPEPLVDRYLVRLLDLAKAHRIPVTFFVPPLAEKAYWHIDPGYRQGFVAYLKTRLGDSAYLDAGPVPLSHMGDGSHVSELGAAHATRILNDKVLSGKPSTAPERSDCEAHHGC
jgi:hypothetical protein